MRKIKSRVGDERQRDGEDRRCTRTSRRGCRRNGVKVGAGWRSVATLLLVAPLLFAVFDAWPTYGLVGFGMAATPGAGPVELIVSDGVPGRRLERVEPRTLADAGDAGLLAKPSIGWTLSADGSTSARIEYQADGGDGLYTAVIHDGLDGPERSRFQAPARVAMPWLNADGAVLVVLAPGGEQGETSNWLVIETVTGRLRTTVEAEGLCCGNDGRIATEKPLIDAQAGRLYKLVRSGSPTVPTAETASVQLVAVDLETGADLGRLVLPTAAAELWQDDDPNVNGDRYFRPGVALSADGRRLAIVHPGIAAVTLIDAARLVVERTVAIRRPSGLLQHVLRLLLPLPQDAVAKAPEGTNMRAVFGPDDRHLYVFGYEDTGFGPGNVPTFKGLGLHVVNLDRADLAADALPQEQIDLVLPAPDGRSIYTFGPEEPDGPDYGGRPAHHVLRRLDATTLDVLAARRLFGERQIFFHQQTNDRP